MRNKEKYLEIFFTLFLLSIFLIFVIIAITQYDRQTRSFPLVMGIPGLLLTVILFASYYIPFISDKITSLKQKELFETEFDEEEETRKISNNKQYLLREYNIIMWIIFLLIAIYFFGFLIIVPVFIFVFLKFREKESWIISIFISIGSWGAIYFLFLRILKAQLFKGIFFM